MLGSTLRFSVRDIRTFRALRRPQVSHYLQRCRAHLGRTYALSEHPVTWLEKEARKEFKSILSLRELSEFLEPPKSDSARHDEHGHVNGISTGANDLQDWSWDPDGDRMELRLPFPPKDNPAGQKRDDKAEQKIQAEDTSRRELFAALEDGDPTRLLNASLAAFQYPNLIRSLALTTAHEIFRSIDLEPTITRYHRLARMLSPAAISKATSIGSPVRQITLALETLHESFAELVKHWRGADPGITIPLYKVLLRLSALLGDASSARALRDMMNQTGLKLDLENTNSYLQAICWQNALGRHHQKLRVTSQTFRFRQPSYDGSAEAYADGYKISLRDEASRAFEELIDNGHSANAETFSLLALAMGRVGDLDGVAGVLEQIWDIKVSEVMAGETDTMLFENDLQRNEPLYPNSNVLFIVAHIYGSNNELNTAIRLVEHISTRYSVRITSKVWEELTRWCYVLSVPRTFTENPRKRVLHEDLNRGHVSPRKLEELFKTMLSPKYNVKPSLAMWDWRLKNLWRQREPQKWLTLFEGLTKWLKVNETHWPSMGGASKTETEGKPLPVKDELDRLDELLRSTFLFRWIRLMLSTSKFIHDKHGSYYYETIPELLYKYKELWCKNTDKALRYSIPTGFIQFHRRMLYDRTQNLETFILPNGLKIARPTVRRNLLPFLEKTYSERRNEIAAHLIRANQSAHKKFPLVWYEDLVQDWLWFSDGRGAVVRGGRFEGNDRKFRIPPDSFSGLDSDQQYELQQRIMGQDQFVFKSIRFRQASQGSQADSPGGLLRVHR